MKKYKSRESQLEAWRRWAASHPDKANANRKAWAKSENGRAWLSANQKKINKRRDAWRARKRLEAKKVRRLNDQAHPTAAGGTGGAQKGL